MSGGETAIFVGAPLTNNTSQQSPISKTRPDRDIMVNRSDMISKCDREQFNKKTSYPNPQLLKEVGGFNIITDIFKNISYLGAKTLGKLQYIIQLGSFNLSCKMLFSLIATDVKKLTVVGEAFQSRNI